MFKLVVLLSVVAYAAAIGPLGWGGWAGPGWAGPGWAGPGWAGAGWAGHLGVAAPLAAPLGVAGHWGLGAPVGAYNYRGPLSLAPGQPANVLAADGRPLDTLSVNLDRAAHITAKAIDPAGGHILKKRSAPLWAAPAVAVSHTARIDAPARIVAAPVAWPAAPLGYHGALGLHGGHLGWGRWGAVAPLGHLGLGHLW